MLISKKCWQMCSHLWSRSKLNLKRTSKPCSKEDCEVREPQLLTWEFRSPIPHRKSRSVRNPSIHQCSHGVIYIIQHLIRSRSQVFIRNCGTQINSTWVSIYFSQHLTLKAKLRQRNVICVLHLLLIRFAVTFSTRIRCKEYSQEFHPLCCLLTNTNIHRFKTVVYSFSVIIVISWECHWKLPASVSIVVCGSKIRMYGQHLYQLLHDYPAAKLLKTRWMSLHAIFCYL